MSVEDDFDDAYCETCGVYLGEGIGEQGTLCPKCAKEEYAYYEQISNTKDQQALAELEHGKNPPSA